MNLEDYKYIIVGAGFYGAVIAERIASDLNERVLVIDKRNHIGGNCYSEIDKETGIEYHKYGTHIFHTSNEAVWDYINKFTTFNSYYHQVLTTYKDKVYQMPINLETINSFYNLNLKPYEVNDFIKGEKIVNEDPKNFEEKALTLIGKPLYEAFIKGYTQKQWGRDPKDIPASVLHRLPFRNNYNESYYFSRWQGIPLNGYAEIFKKLLTNKNIEVQLSTDFFEIKNQIPQNSTVIYTGPIDKYYDFKHGKLNWRTLRFEKEYKDVADYQGTSVMNYAEKEVAYTRIHEPHHLHPERNIQKDKTLIIKEFSEADYGDDPYYPINDGSNNGILQKYKDEASQQKGLIIGGRLGDYSYYDMHDTIRVALETYYNKIKLK